MHWRCGNNNTHTHTHARGRQPTTKCMPQLHVKAEEAQKAEQRRNLRALNFFVSFSASMDRQTSRQLRPTTAGYLQDSTCRWLAHQTIHSQTMPQHAGMRACVLTKRDAGVTAHARTHAHTHAHIQGTRNIPQPPFTANSHTNVLRHQEHLLLLVQHVGRGHVDAVQINAFEHP